jgi:hypothetical protein
LGDDQVSVLVGYESTFVHVPGQDPIQDYGAGQGGHPVHVRVSRVEGVKPEGQRLDVTYCRSPPPAEMEPAGNLADALVQICADYLSAKAATADNPDTYQVIIHAGTRALTSTEPAADPTPAASPEPAGVSSGDPSVPEARATTRYRHLVASLTTDANRIRARTESLSIRRGLRWANVAAG